MRATLLRSAVLALCLVGGSTGTAMAQQRPAEAFGVLFLAVQNARVFPDSKTFADAEPLDRPAAILTRFASEHPQGKTALRAFVERNFRLPDAPPRPGLRAHIRGLWSTLTRPPLDAARGGSALGLPAAYVVPGGRFRELYYWDSYFTMLGLRADRRDELVDAMLDNFSSLIERYGFIPNGTRSYYLSRSQPPFFAAMAGLARPGDPVRDRRLLAALKGEHAFWMRGARCAKRGTACEHVVLMPDGSLLNRYWDSSDSPRDESYAEDVATAHDAARPAPTIYRDLRAAAESGWDFSSRWLADPTRLASIRATAIVPVDLNSLLWQLERTIAERCMTVEPACAKDFAARAAARKASMTRYLWDGANGRFADWDSKAARPTSILSAATLYPLFVGLATPVQAHAVAATTRARLIAPGGLRTTLTRTGQQWDAPNGWAPLQWVAVAGLARFGEDATARDIARRWIATVDRGFRESGKLVEKYDVEERRPGGGGEYSLQDGFGWTNGVTSALLARYPEFDPDTPVAR